MNEKILIIDDDEEICFELKEILIDEGYDVSYETNGLKGFDRIKNENFNLIIQDLKLPGVNGIDLLNKIKSHNNGQKVIILTGRPLSSPALNEDKIYKAEETLLYKLADKVLNKPFNITEIIKSIKTLINK